MATKNIYDLIIIGSGPGGYVAAVRAAQLGLKTACIEKSPRLGGVCLNVGCIPSKALLDSSEYYHLAKTHFADHGIKTGRISLDLPAVMARKDQVVKELTENVYKLLDGNGIDIIQGTASLTSNNQVKVATGKKGAKTLEGKHILLATGSTPVEVPGLAFDGDRIVDSSDALNFTSIPKHLGIVGAGYIGLELGSVWRRYGSKVSVIEMLPKIAPTLDGQVARALDRILKKQGFGFRMNTQVANAKVTKNKVQVVLKAQEKTTKLTVDRLLVSVGRRPMTKGLGLEKSGSKQTTAPDKFRLMRPIARIFPVSMPSGI